MIFSDYDKIDRKEISPSILWEYDLHSKEWNWDEMAERVVERVLLYGKANDYYAMFQLYGGFKNVAQIAKKIPELPAKELNWVCFLLRIKKEDMLCYTRKSLRQKRLTS